MLTLQVDDTKDLILSEIIEYKMIKMLAKKLNKQNKNTSASAYKKIPIEKHPELIIRFLSP